MPQMYGGEQMSMAPTAMQSRGGHNPQMMMPQQQHLKGQDEFAGQGSGQQYFNNGSQQLGAKNAGASYGYGMSPMGLGEDSLTQHNTTGSHNQPGQQF